MEFLWAFRKQIGLALVALAIFGYIGMLKVQIHNRDSQIEQLVAANVTLTAESEARKQTIARLAASLQTLTDEGKRKQAKAESYRIKYEESVKRWQEVINGGLGAFRPNPGEDECQATKRLLKEFRK